MVKKAIFTGLILISAGPLWLMLRFVNVPLENSLRKYRGNNHSIHSNEIDFELYVRLTSSPSFREQLENWLFKSIELFFPRRLASTIIVFDSEKQADREYASKVLHKYDRFDIRVCYMDPIPENIIHKWGKERMYLDMMHADSCKLSGYVGFVDVDTLFVTAVTQDLLFENGKPIVTGRIGVPRVPCWIDTAEYVLGLKQVVPSGKWDGTRAIPSMVNATYFEKEVLPSEKIPIPRSSVHIRHFMLNGRYQDAVSAPLWYTNKILKEGFCYSFGHAICPEQCTDFDSKKLQDSLFAFENYRWQWDPRCLEAQFKHYQVVKDFLGKDQNGFITDVKNKTNVCDILRSLS